MANFSAGLKNQTKKHLVGDHVAYIKVRKDPEPIDPRYQFPMGRFDVPSDSFTLVTHAQSLFGDFCGEAIHRMMMGEVVWRKDNPYIGLERYQEICSPCSGKGFSPGNKGVLPFAGIWVPCESFEVKKAQALKLQAGAVVCPVCGFDGSGVEHRCVDCGADLQWEKFRYLRQAEEILRKELKKDLDLYNQYVSGDVWMAEAVLLDKLGNRVVANCCSNMYEEKQLDQFVDDILHYWRQKYGGVKIL